MSTRLTAANGRRVPFHGVCYSVGIVWKIYHSFKMRREQILERKRREYRDMVPNYYDIQAAERSAEDDTALRQVRDPLYMQSLCNTR